MSFNFKALSERSLKPNPVLEPGRAPSPYTPKTTGLKMAILFSFVLSLAALAGAGILFNDLTVEKQQREVLEASHTQLQQKSEVFEKSSNQYKTAVEKIQIDLRAYSSEKADLKKQLEDSRSQMEDLRTKIKTILEKNKAIEEAAGNKIIEAGARTNLSFSPVQNNSTAPTVLVPSASPAASNSAQPEGSKQAKVLSVNRKFNFAVVNMGLSQKLKIGDPLEVIRAGKSIARLQVEKLYEGFCAASIVQELKELPVKEGDLVRPVS